LDGLHWGEMSIASTIHSSRRRFAARFGSGVGDYKMELSLKNFM
jgi:hypothetical protein